MFSLFPLVWATGIGIFLLALTWQETTPLPEAATGIPGPGIRYATDTGITALREDGTILWT